MKRHYYILLVLILFLSGCKSDDDAQDANQNSVENLILGNWRLVNYNSTGVPVDPAETTIIQVAGVGQQISDNSVLSFLNANSYTQNYNFTIRVVVAYEDEEDDVFFEIPVDISVLEGVYEFLNQNEVLLDPQDNVIPISTHEIIQLDEQTLELRINDAFESVSIGGTGNVALNSVIVYRFEKIN